MRKKKNKKQRDASLFLVHHLFHTSLAQRSAAFHFVQPKTVHPNQLNMQLDIGYIQQCIQTNSIGTILALNYGSPTTATSLEDTKVYSLTEKCVLYSFCS